MDDIQNAPLNDEVQDSGSGGGFFRFILWTFFAIICLIVFTIIKAPQDKVHSTLMSYVNQALSQQSIQLVSDEGKVRIGLGLSYEMSGLKFVNTSNGKSLKISEFSFSPSLLGMISGKMGGHFILREGTGKIEGDVSLMGEDIDLHITLDRINLGKTGLLSFFANVEGTADINGEINIFGSPRSLTSLKGNSKLKINRVVIDPQSLFGFNIPRLSIADGDIDLNLNSGKAEVKQLQLGKQGSGDDLFIKVTGSSKLGRTIDASDIDVRVQLALAGEVAKTFALLDAILGNYKKPDGTYTFKLSGPITAAMPQPDT